jgi:BASS family bile acid:Na+ symporter
MAIPPAIYSLIMFFTAGAFGWLVSRRGAEPAPQVALPPREAVGELDAEP